MIRLFPSCLSSFPKAEFQKFLCVKDSSKGKREVTGGKCFEKVEVVTSSLLPSLLPLSPKKGGKEGARDPVFLPLSLPTDLSPHLIFYALFPSYLAYGEPTAQKEEEERHPRDLLSLSTPAFPTKKEEMLPQVQGENFTPQIPPPAYPWFPPLSFV